MDKPTLDWFSQLTTSHPEAPETVRALGQSIKHALQNKHLNKTVNRAFARHRTAVGESLVWLNSLSDQIARKSCALTTNAWEGSIVALQSISDSGIPSECWGLQMQRGRQPGFSKTLEAVALSNYLQNNPELDYSKTRAIEAAAHIMGIHDRDIWDYSGITPINKSSENAMAAFVMAKNKELKIANKYFDPGELFDQDRDLPDLD